MLDSTAKMANDYDIDITNDDIFEVNSFDSCIDDDYQWHMNNIILFKADEIIRRKKALPFQKRSLPIKYLLNLFV